MPTIQNEKFRAKRGERLKGHGTEFDVLRKQALVDLHARTEAGEDVHLGKKYNSIRKRPPWKGWVREEIVDTRPPLFEQFRLLRHRRGWTLTKVETLSGVSRHTLSKWESGKHEIGLALAEPAIKALGGMLMIVVKDPESGKLWSVGENQWGD